MQKLLKTLNHEMLNKYVSVNPAKNPVARGLSGLTQGQLEAVIGQYSQFPKQIVSFLLAARDKARSVGYTEVAAELTRNMGEELGTETEGVTHYQMLLKGLENEVGGQIEEKLLSLKASPATEAFVQGVRKALVSENPAYVLGAMYAVESSAVPELRIVKDLIDSLTKQVTGNESIQDPYLAQFFNLHLGVWEPGHEEGLRTISTTYLRTEEDASFFAHGFRDVMTVMDAWWNGMYEEIM